MSVEEHKAAADGIQAAVQVVVVSSTRTESTDQSGLLLTELLEQAGHRVLARHIISDDAREIRGRLREFADDGVTNVVVLTGGTGISRRDVTADAVEPLFDTPIPGFGELFRWLSFQEVGSAAMLSRTTAGMLGPLLVFAVPGSSEACRLAAEKLIIPELPHFLRELTKEGPPEVEVDFEEYEFETEEVEQEEEEVAEEENAKVPPPSGKLGVLGRGRLTIQSEEVVTTDAPDEKERPLPPGGWRRAVYEIQGEVLRGEREELPWDLESISPVVDVLHTAGEVAVLKLPSGVKYSLFAWPDFYRDGSKVLLIGWGQPLAEVVALHRFPHLTGTCIEEERGFMPNRNADVAQVCETITGRAPKDTSGQLFAVQADEVWIQRGNSVIRWDGRKEHVDGSPRQVISTLVLHWSNK